MREIKFRAWDGERMLDNWLFIRNDAGGSKAVENLLAHAIEVMQFSGLHDKNGKEIYEGDVIRCNGTFKRRVDFEDGAFVCNPEPTKNAKNVAMWYQVEVIGNIYEDPKLLTNK